MWNVTVSVLLRYSFEKVVLSFTLSNLYYFIPLRFGGEYCTRYSAYFANYLSFEAYNTCVVALFCENRERNVSYFRVISACFQCDSAYLKDFSKSALFCQPALLCVC